jgi:hypothetical protein
MISKSQQILTFMNRIISFFKSAVTAKSPYLKVNLQSLCHDAPSFPWLHPSAAKLILPCESEYHLVFDISEKMCPQLLQKRNARIPNSHILYPYL